jgi:hypothetical protein
MVVFEKTSGRYYLGRWAVKGEAIERKTIRNRFRIAASAQVRTTMNEQL